MRNQPTDTSETNGLEPIETTPDLMAVIAEIEQRVGELQTLDIGDADELERERVERLEELANRQGSLEAKDREQAKLRDSMVRQQAEIDRLAADMRERELAVSSRESDISGQTNQMEQMSASLEAARKELAEQQTASSQLAQAQEREQRRLSEYKEFLAQREKELELQAEQQRKLRRELTEVAGRLAQAEKQNAADAARSEEERTAAALRIKELEGRCESFEESCKLLKSKRGIKVSPEQSGPVPMAGPAVAPVPVQAREGALIQSMTSVPGLIVLMTTVAALAVSAWLWLYAGEPQGAIWVGGAAYLIPLLGCAALKRRGLDMGLMIVAMFAGLLGAWFEPWLGVVSSAIDLWQLPLEMVPAELAPQISITAAVLSSMLALSVATGLATGSFEILFRGIFVSIATSSLLLLPGSGVETVVASIAVWVLLHTMMLVKWSMPQMPRVFAPRTESQFGRPAL
jgi:hypothetical protein